MDDDRETVTMTPDELPRRPMPPEPDECCGSGCTRCVYDLYDDALAEWEKLAATHVRKPTPAK